MCSLLCLNRFVCPHSSVRSIELTCPHALVLKQECNLTDGVTIEAACYCSAVTAPMMPPVRRAHCWGCDNGSTSSAMRRLLAAAEAAKVELSSEASTSISTPSCGDLDMRAEQLAAVSAPLLRRLGLPLSRVAAETFLTWSAWCVALAASKHPAILAEWHKLLTRSLIALVLTAHCSGTLLLSSGLQPDPAD